MEKIIFRKLNYSVEGQVRQKIVNLRQRLSIGSQGIRFCRSGLPGNHLCDRSRPHLCFEPKPGQTQIVAQQFRQNLQHIVGHLRLRVCPLKSGGTNEIIHHGSPPGRNARAQALKEFIQSHDVMLNANNWKRIFNLLNHLTKIPHEAYFVSYHK